MASLAEMAANIRKTWLRNPLPQKPTVEQIYQTLLHETQHFHNRISNSGKPWIVGTASLTIPALTNTTGIGGEMLVQLPAECGKVLLLVAKQTGTEYLPTVFIPELVNVGDLYHNVPLGGWYWYGAGAERIGMYQQANGSWYIRVVGYSTSSREYDVLYTVGDWASSAGPESSPVLKEHHHLIEARTAFSLLDEAAWFNDDEKDMEKRKGRLLTLTPAIKDYEAVFDQYIRSLRTAKLVTVTSGVEY